mmetsp:Transcript_35988/g.94422  ORF Transcript_35988/g.94422 Transcript_35988/m.94422 type:complete len:202 (+) Transcript_35988:153-758(+)
MGKKKKTKKGSKKGGKKGAADASPAEQAAQKMENEMQLIRRSLAERTRESRQAAAKSMHTGHELEATADLLAGERQNLMDVSADLTRQYKTMETKLIARILELETSNKVLRKELDMTRAALTETKTQASSTIKSKNEEIDILKHKIHSMEGAYEGILIHALDTMTERIEAARDKWEIESFMVQQRNKDALLDFGLSHSVAI